jgi:lipoprotein NlpI
VKLIEKLILVGTIVILQGCVSTKDNDSATVGQLIIAEPLPVNYKSEIALARLSEVLHRAEVTDSQKAQLYYDRGVIYDSVGLRSLARLDFNRALRLKPNLVDAYNFLGIHFTQLQEFNQAFDSFDSALDLAPEHEYAYLNRGIALYYGGRPSLAQQDLNTFHQNATNDPYRILWLYLVDHSIDSKSADIALKTRAELVDKTTWARKIIELYLGDLSHSDFMQQISENVKSKKAFTERLCEAYFYLGKYSQIMGQKNNAANYFKLALSTNVYEFVEHRYAKLELDLMRVKSLEQVVQ